jgi:tetratricopeptide (TPR) repeat protein
VTPFLALLDVPVDEASWHTLDPLQRRQQTLDAVKRLLLRESEVHPLVVVFEDLHWIDEAASHAREALALTRRLGARASEAHALCLAGDVASTGHVEDAEGYYREALALAGELGMRPLVAHCHLGLGKLYAHTGKREQARQHLTTATTMYRGMDMRFWLDQAAVEERELN